MTEQEIQQELERDLSAGTEGFRDALLRRCLAVLSSQGAVHDDSQRLDGLDDADLDDDELGMLAAAGDVQGVPVEDRRR